MCHPGMQGRARPRTRSGEYRRQGPSIRNHRILDRWRPRRGEMLRCLRVKSPLITVANAQRLRNRRPHNLQTAWAPRLRSSLSFDHKLRATSTTPTTASFCSVRRLKTHNSELNPCGPPRVLPAQVAQAIQTSPCPFSPATALIFFRFCLGSCWSVTLPDETPGSPPPLCPTNASRYPKTLPQRRPPISHSTSLHAQDFIKKGGLGIRDPVPPNA